MSVIIGFISVKAHIITINERETGVQNLFNFGHSISHALDAILTPTILHGEAISVGVILEAEIARRLGILNQVAIGRLTRRLKSHSLPVTENVSNPVVLCICPKQSISSLSPFIRRDLPHPSLSCHRLFCGRH